MVYGLTIIGISTGVLLVLTALFHTERKKEKRILFSSVRTFLDLLVVRLVEKCRSVLSNMHAGVFRTTIHYVIHHILGSIIAVLTRLQKKMFSVYERNKWHHNNTDSTVQGDGHLNAIAEHKRDTALTPAQRKKMRSH